MAAANHDPAKVPQPYRRDTERGDSAHLSFGSGVHVCLGAPLARLQGPICLQAFIERFPVVRPGRETPRRRRRPFFRGFEVLRVGLR